MALHRTPHLEPPEPVICCEDCEDDPNHDVEQCLADQEEAAADYWAELRADAARDGDW